MDAQGAAGEGGVTAFVARIRGGSARVYRVGSEFALLTELQGRGCDRIEFRHETFLAGSAAVMVGHLLDEMRAARRGLAVGDTSAALEYSLQALPRAEMRVTSAALWRALARADLIEAIIDNAAGQADYATRPVAIHLPHGRDSAPYVVEAGGANLQLLAAPGVRALLARLLLRADADDAGATRSAFEPRERPERLRWMQFRGAAPSLEQSFLDRFGPPFFGEVRRQPCQPTARPS